LYEELVGRWSLIVDRGLFLMILELIFCFMEAKNIIIAFSDVTLDIFPK